MPKSIRAFRKYARVPGHRVVPGRECVKPAHEKEVRARRNKAHARWVKRVGSYSKHMSWLHALRAARRDADEKAEQAADALAERAARVGHKTRATHMHLLQQQLKELLAGSSL